MNHKKIYINKKTSQKEKSIRCENRNDLRVVKRLVSSLKASG